jgi:hypothetical protein
MLKGGGSARQIRHVARRYMPLKIPSRLLFVSPKRRTLNPQSCGRPDAKGRGRKASY